MLADESVWMRRDAGNLIQHIEQSSGASIWPSGRIVGKPEAIHMSEKSPFHRLARLV
jgi:hypothetical protein